MRKPKNAVQNQVATLPVTPVVTKQADSPIQVSLNKAIIGYLQTHVGRYLLGENLLEISLASRKAESGEKRADVAKTAQLLVNGESVSLENLKDSDAITFKLKVIRVKLNTTFSHEVLKAHNETSFDISDTLNAYTDGKTITLEREEFLGETLPAKTILALILNYVKLGKNQATSQKWRKVKGVYEKRVNGAWVAI